MDKTLIVVMGPAAVGKSYFAKKIQESHDDCVIVSRDKIRFALLKDGEDYFAKENEVLRQFYHNINFALQNHKYVIADATHISKRSRNQLFRNVNINNVRVVGVWIEVPVDIALKQNQARTGRGVVPDDVIRNMFKSKCSPQEGEPFDDVIFVSPHQDMAIGKVSTGIESVVKKLERI